LGLKNESFVDIHVLDQYSTKLSLRFMIMWIASVYDNNRPIGAAPIMYAINRCVHDDMSVS